VERIGMMLAGQPQDFPRAEDVSSPQQGIRGNMVNPGSIVVNRVDTFR